MGKETANGKDKECSRGYRIFARTSGERQKEDVDIRRKAVCWTASTAQFITCFAYLCVWT